MRRFKGFRVDRRWCSVGSAPPSLKRSVCYFGMDVVFIFGGPSANPLCGADVCEVDVCFRVLGFSTI